ncbi:MAG: thiamine pyrophosphate-binding protein [Myxococcales bacterium]|nr:thiamine pyrophosphate-binding protein [Myxococcales bacterium]
MWSDIDMGIAAILGQSKTITGGGLVAEILAAEGVTKVFGIIDGTYFGLYSNFEPNGIQLVSPRHETSAAHMAGAYARLSGKLGVCMASNGPGVANVLPGVAVENAEGNRVLLITSSRREGIAYPDRLGTFQCFDQVAVTAPMTKWSCAVPSIGRLAEIMRRALRIAHTGRPGVVHVDIPESIINGKHEVDASWSRPVESYRSTERLCASPAQVRAAARILTQAKKPMIHAGSGVLHAGAGEELSKLATLLAAPITTSWGARAVVDERRDEIVPMQYLDVVKKARTSADAVLIVGSRMGETDWWGKAPYWARPDKQRAVQVDIDIESMGNTRPVDLAIQADAKTFLRALIDELAAPPPPAQLRERRAFIAELRAERDEQRKKLDEKHLDSRIPMSSAHVPNTCRQLFGDDDICVMDGGNTAVWANFFHEVRSSNTVLATAKMGMLGAGVSQALGAQVAHPGRRVYCIIGDGAMGMHQQEIETAVRNKLPVIYLVLCDKQWGMVKMNQQFALKPLKTLALKSLGPDETINADLSETRFDDLARAMGAYGERVSDPAGLAGAIERAKQSGRCAVIHVDVDPVKHMWAPALKAFKDMHAEPKG